MSDKTKNEETPEGFPPPSPRVAAFARFAERRAMQEKARSKRMRRLGLNPYDLSDLMHYLWEIV